VGAANFGLLFTKIRSEFVGDLRGIGWETPEHSIGAVVVDRQNLGNSICCGGWTFWFLVSAVSAGTARLFYPLMVPAGRAARRFFHLSAVFEAFCGFLVRFPPSPAFFGVF
jgi:hypothetical protein